MFSFRNESELSGIFLALKWCLGGSRDMIMRRDVKLFTEN